MDAYDENTNEYKTIANLGVKVCDDILSILKNAPSNTESAVTLFSGFDNITMLYLSLLKLLDTGKNRVFCKTSLLALSRSMIELTNTIHFFFMDKIDKTEAEFRLDLFNYMSKKDRFEIVKRMNADNEKLKQWGLTNDDILESKAKIEHSIFFNELIEKALVKDIHCLSNDTDKKNKYYKRHLILKSRGIKTELVDWYYKMSSTFAHGSPASIDSARQHYINEEYIGYDTTGEALSTMQIASSFYCCTLLDVIDFYKIDNKPYIKQDKKLIMDYRGVITNGH